MLKQIREELEYIGARFSLALVGVLPPKMTLAYARFLARIAFLFMRKRRNTAISNILKAGIAADKKEAKKIARSSFESMAQTVAESFIVPKLLADPVKQKEIVQLEVPEETKNILKNTKTGAILVSGHLGNWELGAQTVTQYIPLTGIARAMNNKKIQALMDKYKMRDDFETIDKHDSHPLKVIKVFKRNRALAILTDQHAHGSGAVETTFFNRPVMTYSTPAVLHRLTKAPIFMVFSVRTGFLKFKIVFSKPIDFTFTTKENARAEEHALTQKLSDMLEAEIRKYPEQYLWAHRRWKYAEKMGK